MFDFDRLLITYRYAQHYISLKMKKLLIVISSVFIVISGCEKEKIDHLPPTINFVMDSGFVYTDTTLALGESFKVGIIAENPNVNLTNFLIKVETDTLEVFLDSGMNIPILDYEKTLVKGIKNSEKWIFIIRDRDGKSNETSFNIFLDSTSAYGNINYFPVVELGAQNNSIGSFYSLTEDSVYNLETAFTNQSKIDLCYYYDFIETDENTIASPGANIDESVYPGENGLSNWQIRRTSRFKLATNISEEDFLNATNDSLLLAVYGQSDGNRKAKNLHDGIIYSFKNEDGKVGLFKVNSVTGTDNGIINISIKVQE